MNLIQTQKQINAYANQKYKYGFETVIESDKPVDVTELLEKLLVISKRLVAIDYEGVIKDAGAVSIGIPEHVFGKFIAISVSGPAQRIKNKEIDIEKSLKAIILPYILKA